MKINFTKQEYRLLLDLLHIADWVLHAHDTEQRVDTQPYTALMQRLLACASEMGCEEFVVFDQQLAMHYPSLQFEEETAAGGYIEEFEEHTFWEQLIAKLAERDVLKIAQVASIYEIDLEKRITLLTEAEEKWAIEVEQYGLDRMRSDAPVNGAMQLH